MKSCSNAWQKQGQPAVFECEYDYFRMYSNTISLECNHDYFYYSIEFPGIILFLLLCHHLVF